MSFAVAVADLRAGETGQRHRLKGFWSTDLASHTLRPVRQEGVLSWFEFVRHVAGSRAYIG